MANENVERHSLGHIGGVELCESKGSLAQLAVLLLRVGKPFHQAVLMDVFDAAAAFTRIE